MTRIGDECEVVVKKDEIILKQKMYASRMLFFLKGSFVWSGVPAQNSP